MKRWQIPGAAALSVALGVAALAFVFWALSHIEQPPFMDFWTYYHAGLAWKLGLNPYEYRNLTAVTTTSFLPVPETPFLYHPIALPIFALLSFLDFNSASLLFTAVNSGTALTLLVLWTKIFLRPSQYLAGAGLALLLFFGLDFAGTVAIVSGNIALIETLVIWIGIAGLMKERRLIFLVAISLAGLLKGVPLLLTPLIFLLPERKRSVKAVAVAAIIVTGIWFSPLLWHSTLLSAFTQVASARFEIGRLNPCSLSLLAEVFDGRLTSTTYLVYAAWVVVVGGLSALLALRQKVVGREPIVALWVCAYILIAPRFKDYSYVQFIPAAVWLSIRFPALWILQFGALGFAFRGADGAWRLLGEYSSFLAVFGTWIAATVMGVKGTEPNVTAQK